MKIRKFSCFAFAVCCLLVLVATPCLLMWRAWRQERLDQALIAAVHQADAPAALAALAEGADINAHEPNKNAKKPFYGFFSHEPHAERPAILIAMTDRRLAPVVERLLQQGAKANVHWGSDTLLHIACRYQGHRIVALLLQRGLTPRATDAGGETPLHIAATANDMQTIRLLLDAHADVNAQDDLRETAIMKALGVEEYAYSREHLANVCALLQYHPDLTRISERGWTVFTWAKRCHYTQSLALLNRESVAQQHK